MVMIRMRVMGVMGVKRERIEHLRIEVFPDLVTFSHKHKQRVRPNNRQHRHHSGASQRDGGLRHFSMEAGLEVVCA